MKYDYVYDSVKSVYEQKFDFKGNDKPITLWLSTENLFLQADRLGNAVFFDKDGKELFKDCAVSDKVRFFSWIYCKKSADGLRVSFAVTKTVDNYPNCDGEHDRWDEIEVERISINYFQQ